MANEPDVPAAVNANGEERVLLLVGDEENRRLLAKWLDGDYVVEVVGPETSVDGSFDLFVADAAGLRAHREAVTARKADVEPVFLPVLLVVSEAAWQRGGEAALQSGETGDVVDDVLTVPTRKTELARRIEALLRARRLSLELGERTQQYRRLVEVAPESICLVVDGRLRYCNERGRDLLALADPPGEIDEPFREFFRRGEDCPVADLVARLEAGEAVDEFVECEVVARGERVPVEVTGVAIPYGGEDAVQLLVRDLTDRKRRVEQLRIYGRAMDEATQGICITDYAAPGEPMIYVNEAFERMTGYSAAEALGRNPRMLQGSQTDTGAVERMRAAQDAGQPITETVRNYTKGGRAFWNELTLAPVRDESGTVTHYLGFLRDVSDRVERERHLEAIHEATRGLMTAETATEVAAIAVETADDVLDLPAVAVFLYDEGENALVPAAVSSETHDLFAEVPTFREGEGIAWQVFESGEGLVVDDVRDHGDVYNPDTPVRSELLVPLGEHGVFVSGSTGVDAFDETDARFARTLAMNVESALDRAARERELRERKRDLERFETIVRTAGAPIATVDGDGFMSDVNPAMEALTGYGREELVGAHASQLLDKEWLDRVLAAIDDLVRGRKSDTSVEVEVRTADGDRRRCVANLALVSPGGDSQETVTILRDVTERRRREQRLSVMDRILRHNLRNEMNVVRGRADLLRDDVEGENLEHVAEISQSAEALLSLSESARRFHLAVDDHESPARPVDLRSLVEGVADALGERFDDVAITVSASENAWVLAHETLRIAVEELVENAVIHSDSPDPTVEITVTADGDTVDLAVADDGPGLPAAERRTFEGETESALEHASGLGLWLVNWIVESAGGEATCEDNDPRGTVMRLRLPRTAPP